MARLQVLSDPEMMARLREVHIPNCAADKTDKSPISRYASWVKESRGNHSFIDAAENHPERFAEFMQGMVSRARENPDPYSAEAQIVMEEMIRYYRW